MSTYPQLVVPEQPWAKKRPRVSKGGHRTHQDPKDKAAEELTRKYLREQWCEIYQLAPLTGNLALSAIFYRRNRQIVDLDNLLKHLLDAGNGLLWVDDRQVTRFNDIELRLDREAPRTEILLTEHRTTMTR